MIIFVSRPKTNNVIYYFFQFLKPIIIPFSKVIMILKLTLCIHIRNQIKSCSTDNPESFTLKRGKFHIFLCSRILGYSLTIHKFTNLTNLSKISNMLKKSIQVIISTSKYETFD